jgi:para-aminobenzoate synthetase/4-amino-4-deoxychorismate lyase
MEILAGLESTPRGVYTGAIGYVAPGGAARFSVAIRTAWVGAAGPGDRAGARLEYGTGGGIVWDSDPARELAETRIKARVLVEALAEPLIERPGRTEPRLRLLETLLWRPGTGFVLLERHLARLAASAHHFGFPVSLERVRGRLVELGAELEASARRLRVRLLVGPAGEVSLEVLPLEPSHRPWTVALAAEPIDRKDPFLRHKTTRREVYERALEQARARALREDSGAPPPDDVLLWNREGELTESTVANLVVRLDGRLLTPQAASGLLPGTLRAELLARGRIEERVVRVEELGRAEALYLINSLRGWLPARLTVRPGLERAARLAGNEAPEVRVARDGARSAPVPLP